MDKAFLSSGNLIADRRASYAQMLAGSGDPAAAADLMAQAVELVPGWAAGWDMLASVLEQAGHLPEAIAAWRRVADLDPEGRLGASLKLAVHGAGVVAAGTAIGYVETLFDHYASGFEDALLGRLNYVVPAELARMIGIAAGKAGIERFAEAVDLGCGTGLMGEQSRKMVLHLSGVDLSAGMLAAAGRKGIYDRLEKGELMAWLSGQRDAFDLAMAADVLMYCGALPPVFAAVHEALRRGGLFALSVEAHAGDGELVLRPSLRYAHAPGAVLHHLEAAGFAIIEAAETAIRQDRGEDVAGLLVVAYKAPT